MKCGIVGLPNVGKSTLFNSLSNAKVQAANFPFCTIDANVGVVTVPDDRLFELEKLVNPDQVIPATVDIVDIAGLVKGASKGEGLGNKFLANIRETHALIHVLRCFKNNNITHVEGDINPLRDKEIIETELQLKDLEIIDLKIEKIQKQLKVGDKDFQKKIVILKQYKNHLEKGKNARTIDVDDYAKSFIKELQLLTDKPVLYICNIDEKSIKEGNSFVDSVRKSLQDKKEEILAISIATEADIAEFETYEDRKIFLDEFGLTEPGVYKVIRLAYKLLNYQTYFTAGKKEVKAWTISKGMIAPKAAGVIHTDFEKGFIRAAVIKYSDFIALGSENACREAGKISIEGKEYLVQDGDIIHFRFNV